MCEAFAAANIPLSKLSNKKLRDFLSKYTKITIPHPTALRKKYVQKCYVKALQR